MEILNLNSTFDSCDSWIPPFFKSKERCWWRCSITWFATCFTKWSWCVYHWSYPCLSMSSDWIEYLPGEIVFEEGSIGTDIYFIHLGRCRVYNNHRDFDIGKDLNRNFNHPNPISDSILKIFENRKFKIQFQNATSSFEKNSTCNCTTTR